MGQPVKILDLAERMIRLSGLEPGRDIQIEFTGIRPGERLNEILFARERRPMPASASSASSRCDRSARRLTRCGHGSRCWSRGLPATSVQQSTRCCTARSRVSVAWRHKSYPSGNHLDKLCSCIERGLDVHGLNGVVGLVAGRLPMPRTSKESTENPRVLLGLLDAVEQDRAQSQRLLAAELGIALGLVNAYLKRCVKKGLVKVREAPAQTLCLLSDAAGLCREVPADRRTISLIRLASFARPRPIARSCSARRRPPASTRCCFAGQSDLAEIAALCALEHGSRLSGSCRREPRQASSFGASGVREF